MIRPTLAALLLLLFASPPALAEGGGGLDWSRAAPIVNEVLGSVRSGEMVRRSLQGRTVLQVTPGKGISRASGQLCDGCTDPCRPYDLDVEEDGGETIHQYRGLACAASGNYRDWSGEAPDLLRTLRTRPPGPDPAFAAAARGLLAALGYAEPDISDAALPTALEEFRADAGLRTAGQPLEQSDLTALRETYTRSQGARGRCEGAQDARFVACGSAAN